MQQNDYIFNCFLSKLFSAVMIPYKMHYIVIILNYITMLATIQREQHHEASKLSAIILIANINSKAITDICD